MKGSREGNMKDSAGKFTEGSYHCEPEESQVDVFDVRRFHNLQYKSQGQWPEGSALPNMRKGRKLLFYVGGKYHYHDYMFTTITTLCNCMFPFPRRGHSPQKFMILPTGVGLCFFAIIFPEL